MQWVCKENLEINSYSLDKNQNVLTDPVLKTTEQCYIFNRTQIFKIGVMNGYQYSKFVTMFEIYVLLKIFSFICSTN